MPELRSDAAIIQPLQTEYLGLLGTEYIDALPVAWKSKKEIRNLLHPGYPVHLIPKKGTLQHGKNLALAKNDFDFYEKPLIKMCVSATPYCRFRRTERNERNEPGSTFAKPKTSMYANMGATVRNDGQPYVDQYRVALLEGLEAKKKWVGSKDFQRIHSPTPEFAPRAFQASASGPRQFREEHKEKWLAGPFKTPSY